MRKTLVAAGIAGLMLATCAVGPAMAVESAPRPARVHLPSPTGAFSVGVVPLHLVDHSRSDPWQSARAPRELMVSVFYPARGAARHPVARQMPAGAAAGFDTFAGPLNYGVPAGTAAWAETLTDAHGGAPVAPGRHPVVLYSPGAGDIRDWNTGLVQDLVSHGYIVVTIDHTYEAAAVQFPDGRVADSVLLSRFAEAQKSGTVPALLEKVLDTRVADTRFVLDQLTTLATGADPDAEHRHLPSGLGRAMDLDRIGMFGQSAGGFTAAETMYSDPRIKAGIDLDGTLGFSSEPDGSHLSPVAHHGLDRPFLLMGSSGDGGSNHHAEPSWASFWDNSRGWHADITLDDSRHGSFTDAESLLPQLAGRLPTGSVTGQLGTLAPSRAVATERAYVSAFFDRWLRNHDNHLLDGGPTSYPVTFIR
ncbi:lipase [Kitasatospora kazusensis]|uniref:Lipase n=1 Tax=Kitasatospora kazusensis TaxID=407974 RepID=A0ABP5LJG5_9ACTN